MDMYLAAASSIQFWRRQRALNPWHGTLLDLPNKPSLPIGSRSQLRTAGVGAPTTALVKDLLDFELRGLSAPLDFLTSSRSSRRHKGLFDCLLCSSTLPRGSFVRISDRLLVSSPELCFLQMARSLSIGKLVCLGLELCGVYASHDSISNDMASCVPIASPSLLRSFIERAGSLRGTQPALRSLPFVQSRSASPMESAVLALLCLPYRLGGYGIPLPTLNHPISTRSGNVGFLNSQDYYVCDLYWPDARLAVEYDSDLAHTGSHRIARDSRRRNEIQSMGITVVTITKAQAYSLSEFDMVAHQIARHLGKRIHRLRTNAQNARWQLRADVLPSRHTSG